MPENLAVKLRKAQVEKSRWYILLTLDASRPMPVAEDLILRTLDDSHFRFTPSELRRELDYLRVRQLLIIEEQDGGRWEAKLTRLGIDLVEYTIPCDPGIDRPAQA